MSRTLTCTSRLRFSVIQNSGADFHGAILTSFFRQHSKSRNRNTTKDFFNKSNDGKNWWNSIQKSRREKKKRVDFSSRKRQAGRKEKRKTRRLGTGQSYCTMFTSSAPQPLRFTPLRAERSDHDTSEARTHERSDPHLSPLPSPVTVPGSHFPSLRYPVSRLFPSPSSFRTAARSSQTDGGDLQFGAAYECECECRSLGSTAAARGGCRRGRQPGSRVQFARRRRRRREVRDRGNDGRRTIRYGHDGDGRGRVHGRNHRSFYHSYFIY